MSLYAAVYGRPPSFGLSNLEVPKELWDAINEEDLENIHLILAGIPGGSFQSSDTSSDESEPEIPFFIAA